MKRIKVLELFGGIGACTKALKRLGFEVDIADYRGEFFTVDICYGYGYFEVFGMIKEEFDDLHKYYVELTSQRPKEKKKLIYIENSGCDATTYGIVEVNEEQLSNMIQIIKNLNKNSYSSR